MLDYQTAFGIAAMIVGIAQYTPYIVDVWRGKTKPHAFSWLVWSIPAAVVFSAQISKGAASGALATGITAFLCIVVFVLSLWHGEKSKTRLDWICLALGLISIGLWQAMDDPLGAVILASITYVLGLMPTWRKSIQKPHDETLSVYWVGNLKWILSFFALKAYNATTLLYPVTIMIFTTAFAVLLVIRRNQLKH